MALTKTDYSKIAELFKASFDATIRPLLDKYKVEIKTEMKELRDEMKTDIKELKDDVKEVKDDVKELKVSVAGLKNDRELDIGFLKADINAMQKDLAMLK